MTALTRDDLSVIEGDARISDARLMEVLGHKHRKDLHELIRRNSSELGSYGEIITHGAAKFGPGRPSITYLLNEQQALLLCMFSRTENSQDARRQIIEVFTAWRHGDAYSLAQKRHAPDRFADHARRVSQVADSVASLHGMVDPVRQLTHLPIWSNGHRPPWWHNIPLRQFLTESHRQMTMQAAISEAERKFGKADLPSVSGLNRYWMKLDEVFGPSKGVAKGYTLGGMTRLAADT